MKIKFAWIASFILLTSILFVISRYGHKDDLKWKSVKISLGDLHVSVKATAVINPRRSLQIVAPTYGTLNSVRVDFNSRVEKGQILAEFDTSIMHAEVIRKQAEVRKAASQVSICRFELGRIKDLCERKMEPQASMDAAASNLEIATANFQAATAELGRARLDLQSATAKAPFDGVVLARSAEPGQNFPPGSPLPVLFRLADRMDTVNALADIDEADMGKIKVGLKATFTLDAYGSEIFAGKVSQIRIQPNSAQNVVTYTAVIAVPNPERKLLPGMTARLTVEVETRSQVLLVPNSALKFSPAFSAQPQASLLSAFAADTLALRIGVLATAMGSGRVFLLQKNGVKAMPVWVGLSDGRFTQVAGDIRQDQDVVIGYAKPAKKPSGSDALPRRL